MHTVIARFHHTTRDLDRLEAELAAAGANDARVTGHVVALTFDADSHDDAAAAARKALDRIGATKIKIVKRGKHTPKEPHSGEDREVVSTR